VTLRLFFFLSPGRYTTEFDLVLHKHCGKKQRKRNELQVVDNGTLLARCTARESVDCGYE